MLSQQPSMMIVTNTFCTAVQNNTMNTIKYICPIRPSAHVQRKVSLTMSPFNREKRVMTVELVSSNLLYFQKMVCPKKTNPKKKGITPSKNIDKLPQDFERVAVIKFKLGLYSRYFRTETHASITPNPISTSLWLKMLRSSVTRISRIATSAPKSWKKFAATITPNQKSKNLIFQKNPNYSQSFCIYSECPWSLQFLQPIYDLDTQYICFHCNTKLTDAITSTAR